MPFISSPCLIDSLSKIIRKKEGWPTNKSWVRGYISSGQIQQKHSKLLKKCTCWQWQEQSSPFCFTFPTVKRLLWLKFWEIYPSMQMCDRPFLATYSSTKNRKRKPSLSPQGSSYTSFHNLQRYLCYWLSAPFSSSTLLFASPQNEVLVPVGKGLRHWLRLLLGEKEGAPLGFRTLPFVPTTELEPQKPRP